MSDDLVEKVIDAMSNCGSETVGSRMACAAIAVALEEAADAVGAVGDHADGGAYINAIRALKESK